MSNLLFLDTETTGLDPAKDLILEVAITITKPDLEPLVEAQWLVKNDIADVLGRCDDYVTKMHEDNGLLAEIAQERPAQKLEVIEGGILGLCREYGCLDANVDGVRYKTPLCGNTPSFDRGFLKVHMPKLAAALDYRHVDVSTLIELIGRWYKPLPKPLEIHRAAADVARSIATLKSIRARYLNPYNRNQGPEK